MMEKGGGQAPVVRPAVGSKTGHTGSWAQLARVTDPEPETCEEVALVPSGRPEQTEEGWKGRPDRNRVSTGGRRSQGGWRVGRAGSEHTLHPCVSGHRATLRQTGANFAC